jgi:hypothetical protein
MKICRCSTAEDRVPPQDDARWRAHWREREQRARLKSFLVYRKKYSQSPTVDDFSISMREAFALASRQVPSIVIRPGLVGGNPCIEGTRIPVPASNP